MFRSPKSGLLENDADVLALFRSNPFQQSRRPVMCAPFCGSIGSPPMEEKRETGNWWRRQYLGLYAPQLTKTPEGRTAVVQWPDELPIHN